MVTSGSLSADDVRDIIRLEVGTSTKCDAALPHDELGYMRGPNKYRCRCGNVYEKDGHGGLREVS